MLHNRNNTIDMEQLETLINQSIKSREAIRDHETVLALMWLDAAHLETQEKADKLLEILLASC